MRRRAADTAMRRTERLAAGRDAYEVVEVDATGEQSLADSISEFSGVELSSDDANEWLLDESVLEPAEAPGPCVVVQDGAWSIGWSGLLACVSRSSSDPLAQVSMRWWQGTMMMTTGTMRR